MTDIKNNEFDVIIIGGGITGVGTARDCAMRGLKTLLIERDDIASGASGRNHGLLHSGARYAVKDFESAAECIKENKILRNVASNCVEDTSGLFITLPEDVDSGYGLDYQAKFIDACKKAGIEATAISPKEALIMEPSVNPSLIGAVKVPDGAVDPFKLCAANMLDAKLHGAQVALYSEVTEFIREGDRIVGVKTVNVITGEKKEYRAAVTVNAAGIWGHNIAKLAGVNVAMYPAKGVLLVFGHRVNNVVINRCRKSADGDILVPGDTVCVIGTTSTKIPFEECDHLTITSDEVNLMLKEGSSLAPSLMSTRILRAYAGVRPLVASDDDPTGRSISRGIVLLDHESRDGLKGFITITGGKLMTYRLMAELATDCVCSKLGVDKACETARKHLPDIKKEEKKASGKSYICECEKVTAEDVTNAVDKLDIKNLTDLRRRTRVGMGTCQGQLCTCRATKALYGTLDGEKQKFSNEALGDMKAFLQERWKGVMPVCWGEALREEEYTQWLYKGVYGLSK